MKRLSWMLLMLMVVACVPAGGATPTVSQIPPITQIPPTATKAVMLIPTITQSLDPTAESTPTAQHVLQGVIAFASTSRKYSPLSLLDLKSETINSLSLGGASPTWSPDGQWLAYVGSQSDIYFNKIDGSELTRLTNKKSQGKGNLEWSPDGNFIAYSYQNTTSDGGIAIVNVNDHTTQVLATVNGDAYSPTWSPNSKQIAFMSLRNSESAIELWVIDLEENNVRLAKEFPFARGGNVDWSPDGKSLALVFGKAPEKTDVVCNDIYLIKPDGNDLTRLTEMIKPSGVYKCATHVIWSPDGNYLAFIGRGSAIGNIMYWGWQIYVLDVRSKNYFAVTNEVSWFVTEIDWIYMKE